ncbi:hypothetical protein [Methylovorus glucosotrophus]|uniref:Uncharacterized protein n=1 Tax=Methylovorus glucosotrophus (strain SIP3-4) TaxID=582744 RepID=C6X7W8_METGS|nr:hypothetical protein [Methylovorus glucosotrophus]ACT51295.1 hypothetical protein Msip34_2053 [Methylovorus glucosotrophus SIP3-4]
MKQITQNATYTINNTSYSISLKDVLFNAFKLTHTNLSYRDLKISFLKDSISNEINAIEDNSQADYQLQILLNRLEMVDLMDAAGVDIEDIEFCVNDIITNEEIDYYRNFELTPRGFYKEVNLRRGEAQLH